MMVIFQLSLSYYLHMISVILLASLCWITSGMLWFKLRKSGGIATHFYMVFFTIMGLMAITEIPAVSASTPDQATFWGSLGLMFGLSAWFAVYLSGEYASSDRPNPWRVTFIGVFYGACLSGLFIAILLPPGSGVMYENYEMGFGWSLSLASFFLLPMGIFIIGSVLIFFQFCLKAYRASPKSAYGRQYRAFIYVLVVALSMVLILSMARFIFIESAIILYTLELYLSAIFLFLMFYLFYKEPSVVFLLAQRASCVFILNTAGTLFFEYSFEKEDALTEYIDLFAPALTAVNYIVQESLELRDVEWIRQFSTSHRTFLIDTRLEADLVAVMLVTQPTEWLRRGLSQLMATLITELSLRGTQIDFSQDMKNKFVDLVHKAFPFLKS